MVTLASIIAAVNRVDPLGLADTRCDAYRPECESLLKCIGDDGWLSPIDVMDVFDRSFWSGCVDRDTASRVASMTRHPGCHPTG